MKHTSTFKPALIAISITAALNSGSVVAQDTPDDEQVEIIQVSGIRGSLMRAQAVKMDNDSIVEAISAEDIGKLPDSSIAESLARLPGLSGERVGGRTSGISVRGFKEDFTGTSLNGRELIGIGDNRGVEYDLYPKPIDEGRHILHKANDVLLELRQPRALSRDDVNLHVLECDKAMLGQRGARKKLPQFVIRKIPTRVHVITLAEFRHQSGRATIRHAFPFPSGKDAATHALARVLNCHHAILAR